ncbi:conjugative transposon protein TraJ [Sphingobacterium sp. DR205]|uniref:conjugative transposon protein TraJ n=1 Tax=Sphingobacterium sp. DR205 TaxID=2713573 RepID=UPI0013E44D98|nr:conjugative transposon protein TraJ [Sphingobacterium sp. DR205]QIH33514.1 conjugative transposon protein TraJ [Sphingobacterium sp. DR205]
MKNKFLIITFVCTLLLPNWVQAQVLGDGIYSFNTILEKLFDEMMPLCKDLIDVARAIAGFAALWYIGLRVWKHIAAAEAIDFFPLLRPFAIGMAIMLYPFIISLMMGVLRPLEVGTRQMAKDSHKAIAKHIFHQEQEAMKSDPGVITDSGPEDLEKYEQPDGSSEDGFFSGLKSVFSKFSIKHMIGTMISEILNILYAAASLCINTIRTFYLIVLAIIGPIVFGLSVFDGFQNSLSSWFARFIHVFMWLPVSNIFGAICSKILENMINMDQTFMSTSAYLIFMVIAIVGYTTVPNVAGYIVQAGSRDTLLHKVNNYAKTAATVAAKALI